jgi:hypothetical protein
VKQCHDDGRSPVSHDWLCSRTFQFNFALNLNIISISFHFSSMSAPSEHFKPQRCGHCQVWCNFRTCAMTELVRLSLYKPNSFFYITGNSLSRHQLKGEIQICRWACAPPSTPPSPLSIPLSLPCPPPPLPMPDMNAPKGIQNSNASSSSADDVGGSKRRRRGQSQHVLRGGPG